MPARVSCPSVAHGSGQAVERVLVVCTANISRSPYLEVVLTARLGDGAQVSSAGTRARTGDRIDPMMGQELARRGLDGDAHRSRPVDAALVREADLVITAEAAHRTWILEDLPDAMPRVFSAGQLAAASEQPSVTLTDIARRRPRARSALDIADPYGRGPDAAAAAARHMDGLADRLVELLGRSG